MTEEMPHEGSPSEELLRKAQDHYATLTQALKEAEARIEDQDSNAVKGVAELIRNHWKAFQTTFDLEIDLEKRKRARAGIVQGYALDLDRARLEVGRRLACLKTRGRDT